MMHPRLALRANESLVEFPMNGTPVVQNHFHRERLDWVEAAAKKGPADKVALIEIALRPFGEIVTKGEAEDVYQSVTTAAARAKQALSRFAGRLERIQRRPRAGVLPT